MTNERTHEQDKKQGQLARIESAAPGRTSRSAALTASKEPATSRMIEGGATKPGKDRDQVAPAQDKRRGHPPRSEAAIRADLMHSVATARAPVTSLVASIDARSPGARIQRAKDLAALPIESTRPADIRAR